MPIHDWTRVQAGLFHHFHQTWSVEIARTLNGGQLPNAHYALLEKRSDEPAPDAMESDEDAYARKANRISIHHPLGETVAIIEIVSPGNKNSRHGLRGFVEKAAAFLRGGVHLLVIDLFPPGPRDPQGIHKAIQDEFVEEPFDPPADKPLTLVAYASGDAPIAYIEPVAVGDALPDMPLFLAPDEHVLVPLEASYQATWAVTPEPIRQRVTVP